MQTSLSRRTFTRIALLFVVLALPACQSTVTTTVYLLRHAEKDTGADPGLTAAGVARAEALAELMSDVPVAAIYSTRRNRTQQTVEPLAKAKRLSTQIYEGTNVVDTVRSEHPGETVVVVGHRSNVLVLIRAFGGTPPLSRILSYGDLFVLTIREGGAERAVEVAHESFGKVARLKSAN